MLIKTIKCIFIFLFTFSSVGENIIHELHLLPKDKLQKIADKLKKNEGSLISSKDKRLIRISKLLSKKSKKSINKAIFFLKKIISSKSVRKTQASQALWFLGSAYASLEDYKQSIVYFEKSINSDSIGLKRFQLTLITLSQLYLISKNQEKSKKYLLSWFAISETPQPQPHVFLAAIYYMEKKKLKALKEINKAISLKKIPDKRWLSFSANINLELKKYEEAEIVLSRLVSLYPSDQLLWIQFSGTQFHLNKSKKTLASFQIASKLKSFEKEHQFLQHASLLSEQGIPYLAAKNLKKGLDQKKIKYSQKNYEILGDFWRQAQELEKALKTYLLSTQHSVENGKIFIKLGHIYFFKEDWKQATKYMKEGLSRGKIENKDEVYFQIGWAYYQMKKYEQSIKFFGKSIDLSGKFEIASRQWKRKSKKALKSLYKNI